MKKSAFFVILAGICWGVISLFVKPLGAYDISSMEITGVRSLLCALLYFVILLVTDKKRLKIRLKDIWVFLGTGILSITLFNVCYFYAMMNGDASVAVVLLYTSPVFIMLISLPVFHEKITSRKIVALCLMLGGCVLVSGMLGGVSITPLVLICGVLAGLFYGLYTIFGKLAMERGYDSMTVNFYTFLFASIACLFFANPVTSISKIVASPEPALLVIGMTVVSTMLPYFFYTKGLEHLDGGIAGILAAVEPLVGACIGILVYKETANIEKILGMALIFSAMLLLNLPQRRKK